MSDEAARLVCRCPFFAVAKFEGDMGERTPPTGNRAADDLANLQANLLDPNCVEIVAGGDSLPKPVVWRKVHGPD